MSADPDRADCDFVFVHDPQPAAVLSFSDAPRAWSVWRCHVDTSQPAVGVWDYLGKFVEGYCLEHRPGTPPEGQGPGSTSAEPKGRR
ncbi:hypothetical protein AB0J40_08870 [Amycolatopsis sp. NPDC049691]|uniref:hypothetical protein n=1 Tax=Amycolatopsis sp. NPDC049691 TaxID=3155155 RepID=UPI0034405B7B